MTELPVKRCLDEETMMETVKIGDEFYSVHVSLSGDICITDQKDYSKIYAMISLPMYNKMVGSFNE